MPNTTANKITLFRILLVPVFVLLLYFDQRFFAAAIFTIASLSDFLDGYIARHYNQTSNFGRFIDPLADKILVLSALCCFVEFGRMSAWCVCIVLLREFAVSGLRLLAVEQGKVIAAAWSGKIKTACTMVCIILMLLFPDVRWVNSTSVVLIVTTTVLSGAEYFVKNISVLKGSE